MLEVENREEVARFYLYRLEKSFRSLEVIDGQGLDVDNYKGIPIQETANQLGLRFGCSFMGYEAFMMLNQLGLGSEAQIFMNRRRLCVNAWNN